MSDLTDFLLQRIAEDEAAASRAGSFTPWTETFQNDDYGHLTIQPDRVLAECEAKRRIVARHRPFSHGRCQACYHLEDQDEWTANVWPCPDLCDLASVYADHPDYDQEWKP